VWEDTGWERGVGEEAKVWVRAPPQPWRKRVAHANAEDERQASQQMSGGC